MKITRLKSLFLLASKSFQTRRSFILLYQLLCFQVLSWIAYSLGVPTQAPMYSFTFLKCSPSSLFLQIESHLWKTKVTLKKKKQTIFQKMAGYRHHSIIPCVSTVSTRSDGLCQVPSAHAVHSAYLQNFFDRLSIHTYYLVLRFVLTSSHPVT